MALPQETRRRMLIAAVMTLGGMVSIVLPEILNVGPELFRVWMIAAAVLMIGGGVIFAIEMQRLRKHPSDEDEDEVPEERDPDG